MPFRIPLPPNVPIYPFGLFGVNGSSSKGLYIAIFLFSWFSKKYVPEVPSSESFGFLPAARPDFTAAMRVLISGGVTSNIWYGFMTPFSKF